MNRPLQNLFAALCHTDAYTLDGHDPEGVFPVILVSDGRINDPRLYLCPPGTRSIRNCGIGWRGCDIAEAR